MRAQWRTAGTGLSLVVAMLVAGLMVGAAYAAEGSAAAHGDGKGSAAPVEGGDHASSKGAASEGANGGAKGEAHPPSGGEGKGPPAVSSERGETPKDTAPSMQNGKDAADTNVHVEPVRRVLDKKNKPGENNPASRPPGVPTLTRRLSPPPAPLRNSIGVAVPAPARAEPHSPTAAPRQPSATASPGPGNVSARPPAKPEVPNHPMASPIVTPPAANRGAINGTGMVRRNVGPPRIGGPTASVVGVNGTTIRSKH
jgi:hypothetical protein